MYLGSECNFQLTSVNYLVHFIKICINKNIYGYVKQTLRFVNNLSYCKNKNTVDQVNVFYLFDSSHCSKKTHYQL